MYDDYGFPQYETVAEKKARANRGLTKLRKKDGQVEPVVIQGRTIAKTWWGRVWNKNLESYADYSNRIARGRSYVISNAVLDLRIAKGRVEALVQGSRAKPYKVVIGIDVLSDAGREQITTLCNHRIDTLEQLLEGKFPQELAALFTERKYGLFPSPREIHFDCSCPDWAGMCKHIAAVLYGVGARLDQNPLLFFELRGLNGMELVRKSVEQKLTGMMKNAGKKSKRAIAEKDIADIFGL